MTLDTLRTELRTLPLDQRRHVIAFLVSLEDRDDAEYRQHLATKIDDADLKNWVELDQLDRHLDLSDEVSE